MLASGSVSSLAEYGSPRRLASGCAVPGINPPETSCSGSCERQFQFSSWHAGGSHFTFADGHTRFLTENINRDVFRALLTRYGNELTGDF